jgi:hypothetical protein
VDTAEQHDVFVRHTSGQEERYFLYSHIDMFYPVFVSYIFVCYHPRDIDKLVLDARLDLEEGKQATPASQLRRKPRL